MVVFVAPVVVVFVDANIVVFVADVVVVFVAAVVTVFVAAAVVVYVAAFVTVFVASAVVLFVAACYCIFCCCLFLFVVAVVVAVYSLLLSSRSLRWNSNPEDVASNSPCSDITIKSNFTGLYIVLLSTNIIVSCIIYTPEFHKEDLATTCGTHTCNKLGIRRVNQRVTFNFSAT